MVAARPSLLQKQGNTVSFHLAAWAKTIAATTETDVTPVVDDIETIQNAHFVLTKDKMMYWLYAGGLLLDKARLITPSYRQITTPFTRPFNLALSPTSRPGIADYRQNPLKFKALEEIQVMFTNSANTSGHYVAGAGLFTSPPTPAPNGDIYTMQGTATTAAVAATWTTLAMTWQDTLPAGRYAALGLEVVSASGNFARLIFEDQVERPGSVSQIIQGGITHPMFRMGALGIWGTFTGNRMPNVQVLCDTTDNAHNVYLDLMRIG